jgi:hypothetical protein
VWALGVNADEKLLLAVLVLLVQAGLPQQLLYLIDSNVIYGTRYTSAILSLEEAIG